MQLSPNFSKEELTFTQVRNVSNEPDAEQLKNLTDSAHRMEAVRALLNAPIHVNSGFRSQAVNKAVGGVPTSAHTTGHAVDFISPSFGSPLTVCKAIAASDITFDQLIAEGTWVHISFDPRMRRQVLTMQNGHYTSGL